MVKPLWIFQTRSIGINVQPLATLKIRFWLLEAVGLKIIIKSKFSILNQAFGQPELDIPFAHLGKFSLQIISNILWFSIFAYATVSRGDSILLIGGACDGNDSSRIAKYTFDDWTEVGNLQTSRRAHRAIADGNGRVFVVGGEGRL